MQVLVDAGVHLQTEGGRQDGIQNINNSTIQMILLDSNIYDKLLSDENIKLPPDPARWRFFARHSRRPATRCPRSRPRPLCVRVAGRRAIVVR